MSEMLETLTGVRYVGDANTRVVHDRTHEDLTPRGCQIWDLIDAGAALGFEPDRLRQARAEGFEMCPKCMAGIGQRYTEALFQAATGEDTRPPGP